VLLERSGINLPPDATNDTVLSKCYRNQREVLVTAHALGFGIYGQIVQLLESRDHWQDVGYEVVSEGEFKVGKQVRILRPPENSPLSLDPNNSPQIIECVVADSVSAEIAWVVGEIRKFVAGGLQPEDILVVALDDRNARNYFRIISQELAEHEISSNNIMADPYTEPPFMIPGKVTLSTVYRAKGNEASVVCAVGVDAVSTGTRSGRNKLFTAFTRTKAWLRVSGISKSATDVCNEVGQSLEHFPYIEFIMPDLKKVELIQRDLSARSVKAKKIKDEFTKRLRKEGFTDDEIADILTVEAKE
jgi:superfamily I DNA and RNA helicase